MILTAQELLIIFTLVTTASVVIVITLYLKSRRVLSQMEQVSLENASTQGLDLLKASLKKAENIVATSELEAIKVGATAHQDLAKFETEYKAAIDQTVKGLTGQFTSYLQSLELASQQAQGQSQAFMQGKVNEVFEKFETQLSDLLNKTQAKSFESIELELKSTRSLIDSYKTQQLTLIDENIIAMLERTLSLVLAKKLTLRDQIDLVYESLEKAKAEKFIVWY